MSLHPRRRAVLSQWPTILWLIVVWVLLWGELTWANVLGGLAVGVAVSVVFPLPAMGISIRVRPWHLLRLVWYFLHSLVLASFLVAWQALWPRTELHGAVIGVRLRNPADLYLTVTAELSTLVPGSLVIEAQRITGMLYLHVLNLDPERGADYEREHVLELEKRVLYALASDDELVRAGLPLPGRRGRAAAAAAAAEQGASDDVASAAPAKEDA